MEISKAFRDVFKKKFERLKKEEADQAMGSQPKIVIEEAPSIGETQQKVYDVMKKKRNYKADFGTYIIREVNEDGDEEEQEVDFRFDIDAVLSNNEDKAFKELLDEISGIFQSNEPDLINNTIKEVIKILRTKSKDYSIEFLNAVSELLYRMTQYIELIMRGFSVENIDNPIYNKYKSIRQSLSGVSNYIENLAKRKFPTEYEAPTMEALTGQGRRRRAIRKNAHKK